MFPAASLIKFRGIFYMTLANNPGILYASCHMKSIGNMHDVLLQTRMLKRLSLKKCLHVD